MQMLLVEMADEFTPQAKKKEQTLSAAFRADASMATRCSCANSSATCLGMPLSTHKTRAISNLLQRWMARKFRSMCRILALAFRQQNCRSFLTASTEYAVENTTRWMATGLGWQSSNPLWKDTPDKSAWKASRAKARASRSHCR